MSTSSRPESTTLAFHASRIVVDVGVLIVMLAMSLAFVTAPSGNRSSMVLDALPTVLLLVPIFLITLIPDHTRPIPRVLGWVSLVLGLAAFPYAVVKYLDSMVLARTLAGSVGMGARLLVFGAFVTLVGIAIGLARSFMGLETGGAPGRSRPVRTRDRRRPDDATAVMTEAKPATASGRPAVSGTRPTAPSPRQPSSPVPTPAASGSRPAGTPPSSPSPTPGPTSPAPSRAPHPQPRPKATPARPGRDENPFGEPLFDSIEIPTIDMPERQASLTFEAEDASDRVADQDPD